MSDIIRKLQQRIDRRSNDITVMERYAGNPETSWMADDLEFQRQEQTLDKRIMGELVKTERERRRLAKMWFKAMLSIYKKEK